MKTQDYIEHLKAMGATCTNTTINVVAALPNVTILITRCQLDDNGKATRVPYHGATSSAYLVDIRQDGVWLADECKQTKICDLEY